MVALFPNQYLPPLPVINTSSMEAVGLTISVGLNNWTAAAWTAANRAFFIPFHIEIPILVTKLLALNGGTVSGNIDVGIYSADFTRLVSIGSTPQAGTNAVQIFDIADTLLGSGDYYLGIAMDNNVGTIFQNNVGVSQAQRTGILMQNTAFPLPAVAAPVTVSTGSTPMIGLRQGGTAI